MEMELRYLILPQDIAKGRDELIRIHSYVFRFLADEDGIMGGTIVNKDKINFVYRHITPTDTVVAVGTWTLKK